ncbi:MAG: tetratricopeptide repeat protein [Bacteroidaceae bacterium]|nr:tetratricopeptide repeat protein [Bacteroidaceae bacterium]
MLLHCLAIRPNSPSALYELAQYYMVLKQYDKGMETMAEAVKYAPDNYWYAQGLANFYMQQNKLDEAVELLEDMEKRFPNKIDVTYSLLQIYNRQAKFDRSIELLNKLEVRFGKTEQVSMQKFAIYDQQGEEEKAMAELQSLADEYPTDYRYQVILGDAYMQKEQYRQAYDIYQKILKAEPENAMAMYSLAAYYEQTGQTEKYDQQLNDVLLNRKVDTDTKTDVMRRLIIRNEGSKKDSTIVINLFDRIMEQEPDEADLPMLYAQYLYSKDMVDKAIPVLKQALQIEPTNTTARMTLLGEAVKQEDYEGVIDICQTGTEANPDMLEFYYYLAIGYNQTQRSDSVISVCNRALEHVTDESEPQVVSDFYAIMGDAYHTKNMMAETFKAYESALEYNANNIMALNNYAYYLSLERRDLDKAEEMSYKTVKAEPNNATYLDTYAWILFEKANYEQAKIYIDLALKNDDNLSAEVLEHCGDIYFHTGDTAKALEFWEQAKEKGSQSSTIEQKIKLKKYVR